MLTLPHQNQDSAPKYQPTSDKICLFGRLLPRKGHRQMGERLGVGVKGGDQGGLGRARESSSISRLTGAQVEQKPPM